MNSKSQVKMVKVRRVHKSAGNGTTSHSHNFLFLRENYLLLSIRDGLGEVTFIPNAYIKLVPKRCKKEPYPPMLQLPSTPSCPVLILLPINPNPPSKAFLNPFTHYQKSSKLIATMCSSKSNMPRGQTKTSTLAHINGRPVLQPASNQVPCLDRRNSLKKRPPHSPPISPKKKTEKPSSSPPISPKKKSQKPSSSPPILPKLKSPPSTPISPKNKSQKPSSSPPISPKLKTPRPVIERPKRAKEHNDLCSSSKTLTTPPRSTLKPTDTSAKKPKSGGAAPGSIAAARREEVARMQQQRRVKIAHYGRTSSTKPRSSAAATNTPEEKRCTFITSNSDPVYVAYHDEEWGVPVHDDKLLFELLVLTQSQVGSDWTSVLKKRETFREAFSEFDPETVAKFSEKKMTSISSEYGIELSLVRGTVENAKRIEQVKRETGSFDKYLWGFVQNKPMVSQYRQWQRVPVKSSKSESISKDLVRRGFGFVGPTVIHSFMQAAGLTNDHLLSCPRHLQLQLLYSSAGKPSRT